MKPSNFLTGIIAIIFCLAGCGSEKEDPAIDCSFSTLSLSLDGSDAANCEQSNGSIMVSASGGSGEYQFSLNTGERNSSGMFENIAAGNYTITVSDGDCSKQVSATVNKMEGVVIAEVESSEAGCGSSNGTLTINAAEGNPPYRYALDSGDFGTENTFKDLEHGTYLVRVSDQNDCESVEEIKVLSGISWSLEVSDIISSNCAIPSCHGGTQPPDYREFGNVQAYAESIKEKTQDGSMPPVGVISNDEIQAIACWVDDGAQDN